MQTLWVYSAKGGVGKTFTASALLSILRHEKDRRVAVYDADGQVGGLVRIHGVRDEEGRLVDPQPPLEGVGYYNLRNPRDGSMLLNSLTDARDYGADIVLHDLPGGSREAIAAVVGERDWRMGVAAVAGAATAIAPLTLVHVVDVEIESARSIGEMIDALRGIEVRHVVVRSLRDCEPGDMIYWQNSKSRKLLADIGGIEVDMPRLHPAARARMSAERIPPHAAGDGTALTLAERTAWRRWWDATRQSLRPLVEAVCV